MSPTESQLGRIGESFLAAFKDLTASDHLVLRAPNCLHIFAPSSLNITAPKTNDVFADHVERNLRPVLDHFPVTAKEMHVNEAGRQITIWATGVPEFKEAGMGSTPKEDWDYTGEYIFILDVDEDGKITRVLEFLDSLNTERLRGMMVKARENVGQAGKAW